MHWNAPVYPGHCYKLSSRKNRVNRTREMTESRDRIVYRGAVIEWRLDTPRGRGIARVLFFHRSSSKLVPNPRGLTRSPVFRHLEFSLRNSS